MKAMVLAAGLGTRLRPLTDNRPKALVEVAGRTLLEIVLARLRGFGVRDVIINVHHFADMLVEYLKTNNNFGMRIEVSREEVLLDTGGGLKKAAWFFLDRSGDPDEPFILHNVDVISTIDLRRMLRFHENFQPLATLAVQDRETSRYLLFDEQLRLCGRSGRVSPETRKKGSTVTPSEGASGAPRPAPRGTRLGSREVREPVRARQALAFSGIHVISPRLLPMLTEEGVFSIISSYLRLAVDGESILGFRADPYYWHDLGRPADLAQAAEDLRQKDIL
jgi:NDP-sugar pyrophosphorylase family protein